MLASSFGWAVIGLVFASGFAGLVYQVLWIKQLSLVVGVEVYAITTGISAFFAGLALGGWLGRLGAQGLEADVQQVGRRRPFQCVEQHDGLGHDQADAEQRVPHVQENRRAHAQRSPGSGAAAVGNTFAHHHREIRAGAGHRQQVNQGYGQKLGEVHAHSNYVTDYFI